MREEYRALGPEETLTYSCNTYGYTQQWALSPIQELAIVPRTPAGGKMNAELKSGDVTLGWPDGRTLIWVSVQSCANSRRYS